MDPAALQESVYDVLVGDATLLGLLSSAWDFDPVFSDVPDDQNAEDDTYFPYISFGPDTSVPFDTKDFAGANATLQINVWTRSADYIQAKNIAKRIHTLLHKADLSITGTTHVTTTVESMEFTMDPDGHTRRALMQARVLYYS